MLTERTRDNRALGFYGRVPHQSLGRWGLKLKDSEIETLEPPLCHGCAGRNPCYARIRGSPRREPGCPHNGDGGQFPDHRHTGCAGFRITGRQRQPGALV